MQGPIAQALALVCVGNAALRGRDVPRFWPGAQVFRFSKSCDFRHVEDGRDELIAADPVAWFAALRARGAKGLRLHHTPRPRGPNQTVDASDRMLVGFVGGGPAWLIEEVQSARSCVWQGFDRLGDRQDPEQRIWLNTYLLHGEAPTEAANDLAPEAMAASLAALLGEIAVLADKIDAPQFAQIFRDARTICEGKAGAPAPDFSIYAPIGDAQTRLLATVDAGWVFGGMGSWNDMGAPKELMPEYDRLSEALFAAYCDAICAVANATYV